MVGTTGRLTYQKNPVLFNEIAKAFRGDARIKFLWIGDGELAEAIELAENVVVTGWLTAAEVQKKLRDVDIYISTALWEGLPYAVLEAMNAGKALLLSDCIGNRDLVQNGRNGYLYQTKSDAISDIKTLLYNPLMMKKLGINSYQLIKQKFSLNDMQAKYRELYSTK